MKFISFDAETFTLLHARLTFDLSCAHEVCEYLSTKGIRGTKRIVLNHLTMPVTDFQQACKIWKQDPVRLLQWTAGGKYLFDSRKDFTYRNLKRRVLTATKKYIGDVSFWVGFAGLCWYLYDTVSAGVE